MDNYSGSVNTSVGANSEVVGRNANFSKGFRSPIVLVTVFVACTAGLLWFLLAGPSDREVIEDELARLEVDSANYVGEAEGDGYLYTVDRACGDQITVTINVGEAELDAPRSITITENGLPSYVLSTSTMPGLLNC